VAEVDEFLASMLPHMMEVDTALHKGDPGPRSTLWSHRDPVTLLGAAVTTSGWEKVSAAFEWLASRFSNFESANYEVIAAGLSGDLAYLVCLEHTTGSFGGSAVAPYSLRVTTIFRREDNEWKIVHRHADSYNPSTSDIDRRS
jgi:ketosteroid isomerase-like protein